MFNYKGELKFTHSHEEPQTFLNVVAELARSKRRAYDGDEVSRRSCSEDYGLKRCHGKRWPALENGKHRYCPL